MQTRILMGTRAALELTFELAGIVALWSCSALFAGYAIWPLCYHNNNDDDLFANWRHFIFG